MREISLFQWSLKKLSSVIISVVPGGTLAAIPFVYANRTLSNLSFALIPLVIGLCLILTGLFAGALILEVLKRNGLDLTLSEKLEEQPATVKPFLMRSLAIFAVYAVTIGLPAWVFLRLNGASFTEQKNIPLVIACMVVTFAVVSLIQNRLYANRRNKSRQRLPGILTE